MYVCVCVCTGEALKIADVNKTEQLASGEGAGGGGGEVGAYVCASSRRSPSCN